MEKLNETILPKNFNIKSEFNLTSFSKLSSKNENKTYHEDDKDNSSNSDTNCSVIDVN
jgi:hypothetical protein